MPRTPTYRVTLTKDERAELAAITNRGRTSARKVLYARALLLLDDGEFGDARWKVSDVATAVGLTSRTLEHLKKRLVEGGLDAALERKERETPPRPIVFGGEFEAQLVKLACSEAPEGRARWTIRLLRDKLIELKIVETVSAMTVCNTLKKNALKPHLSRYWKIPPGQDPSYVAAMEDVLKVYAREYDPARPVVCMDESSKQLVGEVRPPIPMSPGQPLRIDDEYERKGVAEVFVAVEPLAGWRRVDVAETRTRTDWALFIRSLLEGRYAGCEKLVLVMDNLNTHGVASLYAAFAPEVASGLADRLEIHYTPKHGSWLNIAEIELSAYKRQCIAGRIPTIGEMRAMTAAWNADRNTAQTKVDWRFRTADARIKLKRLYPKC